MSLPIRLAAPPRSGRFGSCFRHGKGGFSVANFLIGAVVLAILILAARSVYKSGTSGNDCGCGCEGCKKSGSCH